MCSHFSNSKMWPCVLGGVAVGFAAACLLPRRAEKRKGCHVLIVELEFKDKGEREKWVAAWQPLAERVFSNEPNCLSYKLSVCSDNDAKVLIYERYISKADLDGLHRESQKWHRENCPSSGITPIAKQITAYDETSLGHMEK